MAKNSAYPDDIRMKLNDLFESIQETWSNIEGEILEAHRTKKVVPKDWENVKKWGTKLCGDLSTASDLFDELAGR